MTRKYGSPKQVSSAAIRLMPIVPARAKLFVDEGARSALERKLRAYFREPVALTITDNFKHMVDSDVRDGVLYARIHHMFLDASPEITNFLLRFIVKGEDKEASDAIAEHIAAYQRTHKRVRDPQKEYYSTKGVYHNIQKIFDRLNKRYFNNTIKASVVWGRFATRRNLTRKTINLGFYYDSPDKLIRLHPVLDNPWVPSYVITDVIHHEMLHQVFEKLTIERRCIHPPEFLEREKQYKWHAKAAAWVEANIDRLLKNS